MISPKMNRPRDFAHSIGNIREGNLQLCNSKLYKNVGDTPETAQIDKFISGGIYYVLN